jgi:DNA-binding beta-propeller fold protein YncE
LVGLVGVAIACGSDDGDGGSTPATGGVGGGGAGIGGSDAASTGGVTNDAAGDSLPEASTGCHGNPGPENGPRRVVVSHPYDAAASPSAAFGLFDLDADGNLAATATRFDLERTISGEIVFTPDGALGFVATENGAVGAFRFDAENVTVVHPAFQGPFYAAHVAMDPSGAQLYVLDDEWANIGGGIYSLAIGCDGTLSDAKLLVSAKLPSALAFLAPGSTRALVTAQEVATAPTGSDVVLLDLSGPTIEAGATAFADGDAIVSAAAVTHDGKYALVADNNSFGTQPNRIAVLEISSTGLALVQTLSPLEDPYDVAISPHDHTALVSSGFGDALIVLKSGATTPFEIQGPLAYAGAAPQLPGNMAEVRRGALAGHVLVAEVGGIRQVQLAPGGSVTDLGLLALPSGTENMIGAIGVQP